MGFSIHWDSASTKTRQIIRSGFGLFERVRRRKKNASRAGRRLQRRHIGLLS